MSLIAFSLIPGNLRTPGIYIEFDNSKANRGLAPLEHRVLFIGQRRSTGSVAALVLTEIGGGGADQAKTNFGGGSLLHHMVERGRAACRSVRTFAIALDDLVGGVTATGSLTFTGPATAAGVLYLYFAGRRVQVGISSGSTAAQVATAVAAGITAATDLPLTAAVDGVDTTKVNVTARHKGEVGNAIDVRANYNDGEALPAGVGVTIVAMASGAGNPDISAAIAAIGDEWFTEIVMPYTDSTNLTALETELADRWGPLRPIDGHAYACKADTVGNLSTFGNARNSPHVTTLGIKGSPTPTYEIASVIACMVAEEAQKHAARPLTNLPLVGVLAPATTARFRRDERNTLLFDGISTLVVGAGGVVQVDRLITMYQVSPAGTPDESYLDLSTITNLSYLRYTLRVRLAERFDRALIAKDGTRAGADSPVTTPKVIRAEIVALFDQWEEGGYVEDFAQFQEDLKVVINDDPVRVDVVVPPNLTNPLLIIAAKLEFRR